MQPRSLNFDPDTPIRIGPSFETKLLFSLFAFKFRRKATHGEALYGTVFHYLNTPVGVSILPQPVDGKLQPFKGIDMTAVKSSN
jgi:hypothetical protein